MSVMEKIRGMFGGTKNSAPEAADKPAEVATVVEKADKPDVADKPAGSDTATDKDATA